MRLYQVAVRMHPFTGAESTTGVGGRKEFRNRGYWSKTPNIGCVLQNCDMVLQSHYKPHIALGYATIIMSLTISIMRQSYAFFPINHHIVDFLSLPVVLPVYFNYSPYAHKFTSGGITGRDLNESKPDSTNLTAFYPTTIYPL